MFSKIFYFIRVLLFLLTSFLHVSSKSISFSTELIHRDSPPSPFYDPSATASERLIASLRRSFHRATYFRSASSGVTDIFPNHEVADYLMRISIGTPARDVIATADTGSDIIWTQCQPCSYCFEQRSPIYNPRVSSTYKQASCGSSACKSIPMSSCLASNDTCLYMVMYGDMSYSFGNLATETVTMGSVAAGQPVVFPNMIFGCGHRNAGTFSDGQSGVIGLGGGPTSLISQMGASINGKFSYCLVPLFSRSGNSSKMYFGDIGNTLSGYGVVTTPMFLEVPNTFYYLNFRGITVGSQRVDFSLPNPRSSPGNIIIDSGTSLTLVPHSFYNRLELAVRQAMRNIRPIASDPDHNLGLCYDPLVASRNLPAMVAHFMGADLELDPTNTFVQLRPSSICLAFAPADGVVVFGNLAQMNFLVGYDLNKKTVSFKRTDCTKI